MLFDAATGQEKWRQALPQNSSRRYVREYHDRRQMQYDNLLTEDRVLVTEFGRLNAFDRRTGRRLFGVKMDFGWLGPRSVQRRGEHIVVQTSYRAQAFRPSDGAELWARAYKTPEEIARNAAAMAAAFNTYTFGEVMGPASLGGQGVHPLAALSLELQDLSYRFAVSGSVDSASTQDKYFVTTEGKDVSKVVVVAVDLDSGEARTHRLLRFGNRCIVTVIPFEEEGFVIQAVGGAYCNTDRCRKVHAIRIPAD
jgi:hypothetical protein